MLGYVVAKSSEAKLGLSVACSKTQRIFLRSKRKIVDAVIKSEESIP